MKTTSPTPLEITADPFVAVRALNRIRAAGFSLEIERGQLMIEPLSRLTDEHRAFIRAHKPALVQLLLDTEVLHAALAEAGPVGLAWMEKTPADWTPARLLAVGEVLYADGRVVNRHERRYLTERAPFGTAVVLEATP